MKKCSRFHLTKLEWPYLRAIITTNAGEDVAKSNPIHCWWECEFLQPLRKAVWRLIKKLKDRTAI
jgi:hypothetical protein